MTDKQIIIDGCDVSWCKYWKGYCRIASLCDYPGHLCEVTPNCYYKQLKAKEQECERLKHDNGYEVGALEKTIDNLKAENDLLRKTHKTEQDRRRAYENALTEIKEIAEKMKKMSEEDGGELTECFFIDKQCEKCSEDKCLPYWFEQILQKISECEGNDEH